MSFKGRKVFAAVIFIAVFIVQVFSLNNFAYADTASILLNIDNPTNAASVSGDLQISGWSVGLNGIQSVEVYVDSKDMGQATYGLQRQDVQNANPTYPDSLNSGFTFSLNTRGLQNGQHEIKVTSKDKNGVLLSKTVDITTNNQYTQIMGKSQATKEQMMQYILTNSTKGYAYVNNFVAIVMQEASVEGVRSDVAIAQMMKETNFLKFTGTVQEGQNNFAGLGVTGGSQGESFPDIQTGIRAVIQHLKAYASTAPLAQTCVDPRYSYVTKGSAPFVEWLGINENPSGAGWAVDKNYGYDIVDRMNQIAAIKIQNGAAQISSLSVDSNIYAGKPVTITGNGTSINKPVYSFWIWDASVDQWKLIQDYSESNTCTWTPQKPGKYRIVIHVKDEFSEKDYDNYVYKDVNAAAASAQVSSITVPASSIVSQPLAISAAASSPVKALYQFWVWNGNNDQWSMLQDYSEKNTSSFTPQSSGKYRIVVHVKDAYSTKNYDSYTYKDVAVTAPTAKANSITVDSNLYVGRAAAITGSGTSSGKVLYQFWVWNGNNDQWSMIQDYSENNTSSFTPQSAGNYKIVIHVKDAGSSNKYDDYTYKNVAATSITAKANSITVDPNLYVGKAAAVTGSGTSAGKVLYQFWVWNGNNDQWSMLQDYSENNTSSFTPQSAGNYRVVIHVKDAASPNNYDSYTYKDVKVSQAVAQISAVNVDTNIVLGDNVPVSATGTSSNKILYQFWVGDTAGGAWNIIQDYSENNTVTWTPAKVGNYRIVVHVKDAASSRSYDNYMYKDVTVKATDLPLTGKTIVLDPGHGGNDTGAIAPTGVYEKDVNLQLTQKVADKLKLLGANVVLTRTGDTNPSLDDRLKVADDNHADLFISIHHDSSTSSSASGVSTHYSSFRPAIETDDAYVVYNGQKYPLIEEKVDSSGNHSFIINYNGTQKEIEIGGPDSNIAYDPTPCSAAVQSQILAQKLVDAIATAGYADKGIEDHNLYLTRWAKMPAVLIEAGFMSNPGDLAEITDNNNQEQVAQLIADTIENYFTGK